MQVIKSFLCILADLGMQWSYPVPVPRYVFRCIVQLFGKFIIRACGTVMRIGGTHNHWRNRQGEEFPPDIFHREIFADLPGKRGPRKKGKKGKRWGKEGQFEREEVENWKWKMKKVWKWVEDLFFFFFFFFFFCWPLFGTTEIYLRSTKMDNFTGKSHIFHAGKKSGKLTLSLS